MKFLNDTKFIPKNAFHSYGKLNAVQFSPSIEAIGDSAFYNISNVNYNGIATEKSAGYWGAKAINGFVDGDFVYKDRSKEYLAGAKQGMDTVSISDTVQVVGPGVFEYNNQLQSVVIPDSVTQIEENAFRQCANLKEVTLSKKLVRIGNSVFNTCTNLNNIYCPDTLESIGEYAFYGCDELKNIHLNSGLKTIGEGAFGACEAKNIPLLYVPCSVTNIDFEAFSGVETILYSGNFSTAKPWGAKTLLSNGTKEGHTDANEDENVTVTYEANGGSGTMDEEVLTLDSNNKTEFTFPSCTFHAPEKKMFAGWVYYKESKKNLILQADEGDTCEVTENIIVYPVWKVHAPHSFDTGIITKPVTETEKGVITYTCTVCGQTKIETFSKGEEKPIPTVCPSGTQEPTTVKADEMVFKPGK